MNVSGILAVGGILVTVVFGVWGIVIVIRRRYPGELTYVKESYIGLFDSIVKNLSELAVLYNGEPVGQGLVLVKGAILNTGSRDITESMVEQRLSFALPADFRWLTAKIVGTSTNVHASLEIQESSLVFATGLFRCREFLRFQAIAEVPIHVAGAGKRGETIEARLERAISITHRIADTQKVASLELPSTGQGKRRVWRYLGMALGITAVVGITFGITLFKGIPAETHFVVIDTKGLPHDVRTTVRLDGTMTLKGVGDDYRKQVTVDEFFTQCPMRVKVALSSEIKPLALAGLVYIIFPWALCLYAYREHKRADRLRRLLGIEDHRDAPTKKSTVP
jgi:hypothetical protein